MSGLFTACIMIGCLCYFCWRQHFCPTSL